MVAHKLPYGKYNLSTKTAKEGKTTTHEYDSLRRMKKTNNQYDADVRLIKTAEGNGNGIINQYDDSSGAGSEYYCKGK